MIPIATGLLVVQALGELLKAGLSLKQLVDEASARGSISPETKRMILNELDAAVAAWKSAPGPTA